MATISGTDDPVIGRPIEVRLDPIFKDAVESGRVPGVAAIALDASGKVLFSKGYGQTTFGDPNAAPVTTQSPAYFYSCTKLVTTVAALQLLEQGKLRLNDIVEDIVPDFAKIRVLDGFDADGKPILHAPTVKAKVINLFTHTTGFTYDFFDAQTLRYRIAVGEPPANYGAGSSLEDFSSPLNFEPGKAYTYGINTEWLGLVIEKISGLRLDEYVTKNILKPLGMKHTGLGMEGDNFFNIHLKDEAGKLTPVPSIRAVPDPPLVPGGQYLTSTAEDYSQFLLTILNYGTHPKSNIRLLQKKTVQQYIFTDQLSSLNVLNKSVGEFTASIPQYSCTGTFLPGITKGWSLGLMTNSEDLPNGRKAGSGAWAGLANCYYWIDPASGRLGLLVGAVFPFFDKAHLHLFDALERAVYRRPEAQEPGEPGSNFEGGTWTQA